MRKKPGPAPRKTESGKKRRRGEETPETDGMHSSEPTKLAKIPPKTIQENTASVFLGEVCGQVQGGDRNTKKQVNAHAIVKTTL